jgi:ParB/RepB/Spo0J family partition protein
MSDNTTVNGGEARTVERAQLAVEEGFNPRAGLGELKELVASIERHGILQPLLVRPDGNGGLVLVDGHRRLAAAAEAGLERVPVLVREDLNGGALVAALVTVLKREDLDPVEEAKAYGRLVDGGLTRKGAAEAVGVPQRTVTTRLQILEVPEALHPAIAAGQIPLSNVAPLVAMAKVSPCLAELVGRESPGQIDAWAAERAVAARQGENGLWPAAAIDVERLELNGEQRAQVEALSDQWSAWRPRFGEEELDRARAAGVLYTDKDDGDGLGFRSGVICDTELVRELTVAVLAREYEQRQRRLADNRAARGKPEPGTPEADNAKAQRKAELQAERELAVRARGANLDLGRKLLDRLAELDWSKDLAELLAYSILSRPVEGYWSEQAAGGVYTVAQLAGRGLRYVLPDWQEERELKNGTVKVTYAGGGKSGEGREDLEGRFWTWFEVAKTPEQITGRLVIALAAAHWALDECVPRSQRQWCSIYGGKDERARKALERLTRRAVPVSLKRLRKELADPAH